MTTCIFVHPEDKSMETRNACLLLIEKLIFQAQKSSRQINFFSCRYPGSRWANRLGMNELVKEGIKHLLDQNILIIHFDSDVAWSNKSSSNKFKSKVENFKKLQCKFKSALISLYDYNEDDASELVKNVIPMIPFKNFESWSYFNKVALKEINIENDKRLSDEKDKVLKLREKDFDEKNVSFSKDPPKSKYNKFLIEQNYPIQENLKLEKSLYEFSSRLIDRLEW